MGGPKDYGYVATTPGTVVGKGTLTVSNTVAQLLDGGGLIFSTATLGVANLLGYGDPA